MSGSAWRLAFIRSHRVWMRSSTQRSAAAAVASESPPSRAASPNPDSRPPLTDTSERVGTAPPITSASVTTR